jgi:hypothetical protein
MKVVLRPIWEEGGWRHGTASESMREEAESEGELWGDGGATVGSSASPHRLRQAEACGKVEGVLCFAWLPRSHSVEHVARAMEPELDAFFSIFRRDSDPGPLTKFVAL